VSDIEGAKSYVRQLDAEKPLHTDYNKLETYQNYKKGFVKRRMEMGNLNSKRSFRVDDIEGAVPKDRHSITKSKRMRITSAGLHDLIQDIENYRKKVLSKNGNIDLYARAKPDVPNKHQTFNLFNDSAEVPELNKNKKPGRRHIMDDKSTFDRTGLHISSKRRDMSDPKASPITKSIEASSNCINSNFKFYANFGINTSV
jgi:hypothetical protein